jgi:hypothetical protein
MRGSFALPSHLHHPVPPLEWAILDAPVHRRLAPSKSNQCYGEMGEHSARLSCIGTSD